MTRCARVIVACYLSSVLAGSTQAQEFSEDIDGSWEGLVSVADSRAENDRGELPMAKSFQMRLVILPESMKVIVSGAGPWGFSGGHVMRSDPNAVVSSATGADDRSDTWTVSVTKRDDDSLLVFVSLFANPEGESETTDITAVAATGILNRIRDD